MKNIFLEKSYTKCDGKTNSRPSLKNQNWAYLWINSLNFYRVCFDCIFKSRTVKIYCWPLAFMSYKAFSKNKKRPGTSLLALFSVWFLKKNIFHIIFYLSDQNSLSVCLYFLRYGQYVFRNCLTGCDVIELKINLSFLIRAFWHMTKNTRTEI